MRIALATNVLKIPPTYFALNHASVLSTRHQFEMFALAAYINDPDLTTPVHDCALLARAPEAVKNLSAAISSPRQARAIARFRPDLVHAHFGTWSAGPIAGAAQSHSPLVTTLHGYDVMSLTASPNDPVGRWHRRNVLHAHAASARTLAVSRYLADHAIRSGMSSDHVEVHYQGIDTDYFTPDPIEVAVDADAAPLVLFVGVLAHRKGPRDLIEASRALITRGEHRLVMLGTGPLEAELRRETANDAHITIHGSASRDQVRDTIRRAAALVLPTKEHRGWREAAGLVLLEAQACGVPVVAYDSGGVKEMLLDGQTGALVHENDVTALRDAISSMLELDGLTRAALATAARRFVVEHRSLAVSALQLEQHYRDVV